MSDALTRFSDRVDNYAKFRPSYPLEAVEHLKKKCALTSESKIAELGSGTGIFTKLLLDSGFEVFAVEPNVPMREEAEKQLASYPRFHSIAGQAEATTLSSQKFDLVLAAQAFHWFDEVKAREEWKRILRPGGFAAIVWNIREETSDFGRAYEELLQLNTIDYRKAKKYGDMVKERIAYCFEAHGYEHTSFSNKQEHDWESFWGYFQSASYSPPLDHPKYESAKTKLQQLFAQFRVGGKLIIEYHTEVYWGVI